MKKQEYTNKEKGFTLVEVLISLFIFTVAVAGVITVSSQGSMNVNSAKNRVVATFLADEGIELVRGMRDTAVVNAAATGLTESDGWDAFVLANGTGTPCSIACDIDPTNLVGSIQFPDSSNVQPCSSYCILNNTSIGYYTSFAPGTPSIFSRQIVIDATSNPEEATVTSTVTWREGIGAPLFATQTETLFNWYH